MINYLIIEICIRKLWGSDIKRYFIKIENIFKKVIKWLWISYNNFFMLEKINLIFEKKIFRLR